MWLWLRDFRVTVPDFPSSCQDLERPSPSLVPLCSVFYARAGARHGCAAPVHGSALLDAGARPGEPEQDGGRAEDAAWAEASAAWITEPRRLSLAGPGSAAPTRPRLVLPHPFSAAAASARVRPGRRVATPQLRPYRGPAAPPHPGTAPAHCPPLQAQTAPWSRASVPLAWKATGPGPGPPILDYPPHTPQPTFRPGF